MRATRGFTLIELLVVIAIIGILSSVVLASLNTARSKSRDATRASEVTQIRNALAMYQTDNNGNYPSTAGCLNGWCCLGAGSAGRCWAGQYWGSNSVDAAIKRYMSTIPDDPLNNTAAYGDAFMYRVDTDSAGTYATLHWGIEKLPPIASTDCMGGTSGYWGAGAGIGGDYWCMVQLR